MSRLAKSLPRQRAGRPDLIGAKGGRQDTMIGKEVGSQQLKGGAPTSAVQITEHYLMWARGAIRVLTKD